MKLTRLATALLAATLAVTAFAVRPGETVEVSAAPPRTGASRTNIGFSATANGHAVLHGTAVLAPQ